MSRAAPRASRLRIPISLSCHTAPLVPGSSVAIDGQTKFLIATARVLAQRLAALNKEAISVMAQLEKSKSKVPAEDELERLRRRLLREWTF